MMEDFVPYKIALHFKEYFIKSECIATIDQTEYLHINKTEWPIRGTMLYDTINCPTYEQIFRFFRESEELYGYIIPVSSTHWTFKIIYNVDREVGTLPNKDYSKYQDAQNACLLELEQVFLDGVH